MYGMGHRGVVGCRYDMGCGMWYVSYDVWDGAYALWSVRGVCDEVGCVRVCCSVGYSGVLVTVCAIRCSVYLRVSAVSKGYHYNGVYCKVPAVKGACCCNWVPVVTCN